MERVLRGAIMTKEKFENKPFNSVGSSRIRGRWIIDNCDNIEEYHVGRKYDFVIFQKAYWQQLCAGTDGVEFDGVKIFDACDPDWLERDDAFRFYSACDAVVTSTQELADYIKKLLPDKPVVCIPDRIDFNEHKEVKRTHSEKIETVGWFGYSSNYVYIEQAVEYLNSLGIKVIVFSDSMIVGDPELLQWKKYDFNTLHANLIGLDAVLMTNNRGEITLRGKYKSNNKNLTCYALGVPVIESKEDLERLASKEAREKEAKEKLKMVKKEYDIKKSVKEYLKLIEALHDNKSNAQ